MRTIVRVLPRCFLLGIAGGALLVLAERAQEAHAQVPDPPAVPAVPSADLPPVTTPPLTPPAPAPPPVPAPLLPAAPTTPPPVLLPVPTAPTTPAVPGITPVVVPDAPALGPPDVPSAPEVPGVPATPDIPGIDPGGVAGTVGPLPDVPEVSTPEPALPDLSELPEPAIPLNGVLDLSAAPAPAPSAPADALDRAPSVAAADPAPTSFELADAGELLAGIDVDFPPARAPPTETPGSPHPCPGGGSPHSTRADPAAYLSPDADHASRRARMLAEARMYASTLLRDPLLRPD